MEPETLNMWYVDPLGNVLTTGRLPPEFPPIDRSSRISHAPKRFVLTGPLNVEPKVGWESCALTLLLVGSH